jgi:hypothetical protein
VLAEMSPMAARSSESGAAASRAVPETRPEIRGGRAVRIGGRNHSRNGAGHRLCIVDSETRVSFVTRVKNAMGVAEDWFVERLASADDPGDQHPGGPCR